MIRHILLAGLATATLTACNPLASLVNNQVAARQPPGRAALPTPRVTVTATGADSCTIALDGRPITAPALLDEMVALLRRVIEQQGGVGNVTELPYAELDAPADMRFACAGETVRSLFRSGFGEIRLGRGDDAPRRRLYALYPGAEQPQVILRIEGGGRMRWNDAAIDIAGLRQRAPTVDTPVPGMIAIVANPETTIGALYEVASVLREASPLLVTPGEEPPVPGQPPIAPPPVTSR